MKTSARPLGYLLGATALFLGASPKGGAGTLRSCLGSPLPAYLVVLKNSGLEGKDAAQALRNACIDLKDPDFTGQAPLPGRLLNPIGDLGSITQSEIPTLVADMLGDSTTVQEYKERLRAIGAVRNRYERLRRVYDLAVSRQGRYDDADSVVIFTPNTILKRAKAGLAGGVCRDFSALLTWSLMQVNRSPELSPEIRSWGGLDEDSFFARQVSDVPARHAYVEVALPVGKGESQIFHHITLDTTYFKIFSPLFRRRSEITPAYRAQLLTECQTALTCLESPATP